jgi:hypothetical protein
VPRSVAGNSTLDGGVTVGWTSAGAPERCPAMGKNTQLLAQKDGSQAHHLLPHLPRPAGAGRLRLLTRLWQAGFPSESIIGQVVKAPAVVRAGRTLSDCRAASLATRFRTLPSLAPATYGPQDRCRCTNRTTTWAWPTEVGLFSSSSIPTTSAGSSAMRAVNNCGVTASGRSSANQSFKL